MKKVSDVSEPQHRMAFSIDDLVVYMGVSRETIYKAIRDGRLIRRKLGKRSLIMKRDIEAFLAALPEGPRESESPIIRAESDAA